MGRTHFTIMSYLRSRQDRKQAGAMGARCNCTLCASHCTLWRFAWHRLLYRSAQATDILLPRWHQQRAPEVMLYRSAQATSTYISSQMHGSGCVCLKLCCTAVPRQAAHNFLPRWHQQRAPEAMLYRNAPATYIFLPRWQ